MKLPRGEMKRARIEIIPMIDTIFFLLVFFMIASLSMVPMSAHKVDLPSSETASLKPQEKVVVTISKEGDYYVDRERVAENQIKPLVAARVSDEPGHRRHHQLRQRPALGPIPARVRLDQAGQRRHRDDRHRARSARRA